MKIEASDVLGLAKTVRSFCNIGDLVPCNTRFKWVRASPDAWFRWRRVALHRGDGAWDVLDLGSLPPKRYRLPPPE